MMVKKTICSVICSKVSSEIRREISEMEDPRQMWKAIEIRMLGDRDVQLEVVSSSLQRLKFDTINEMISRFRALHARYLNLGGQTAEHDMANTFLRQMPKRFHLAKIIVRANSIEKSKGTLQLGKILQNLRLS